MAGKILSIEIGTKMTYVVEMDYKTKTPKIHQFFSIPTPENLVADGSITVVPEFVEQFRAELSNRKIKTKKVIFVMNSARIANREVVIPLVKEKQIHDLLISNSAEFFPVDLAQYQLVHNIIQKNEEEKQYKLSVLAVPNEIISSYSALAEALKLDIEALDYLGNSIAQGMQRMLDGPVRVVIKIDETTSMLTLMRQGKVELQRNIAYGVEDAAEAVMESRAYGKIEDFADAMEVLYKNTCIRSRFAESFVEEEADEREQLAAEITENMRPLVGNIGRILDYYTSSHQDVTIEEIWLAGIGAECKGMQELLSNELNVRVHTLTEVPATIGIGSGAENFRIGSYMAAVAGTFSPLSLALEKNGAGKNQGKENEMLVPAAVCGICLLVSVGLLAFTFISSYSLEKQKRELSQQIDALQEAENIYQEYQLTAKEYQNLQEMYQLTETPDDALLAFLGEMEEKMPSEIVVETMTAGTGGVNMSLRVSKKIVAADVLVQLRDFSTLSSVSTSGITETTESTGKSSVSFSVYCQYAAPTMEDAQEEVE